jgi:hypothetical protein
LKQAAAKAVACFPFPAGQKIPNCESSWGFGFVEGFLLILLAWTWQSAQG